MPTEVQEFNDAVKKILGKSTGHHGHVSNTCVLCEQEVIRTKKIKRTTCVDCKAKRKREVALIYAHKKY